ncbi:MAG TPA: nitrate- and nitrite sensing domain-containing protein [Acidimicrobiales bacterium]
MLRNNFRTKLLGIVAVPMAALIGITAFAGYDRLTEARDANQLRHRIDVISALSDVEQQVQLEEAVSADAVANPGSNTAALATQRAATDQAVQLYRSAVARAGDVGSTDYNTAIDRVQRNLNALATSYRGAVDLGSDANSVTSAFSEIGASVSDLIGVVAGEANDPSLARETSALAALSHAKDATAKEWAVLDVTLNRGSYSGAEDGTFRGAVTDRDRWLGIQDGLATPESRSDLQTRMAGPAIATSDHIENAALAVTNDLQPVTVAQAASPAAGAAQWNAAMQTRLGVMRQVLSDDTARLADHASAVYSTATRALQTFLFLAVGAMLASIFLALVLARAVTTPLRQLTRAAERLAGEQLPSLVNGLRNPGHDDENYLATTITPIEVKTGDEIGQLAQAFNSVQTVAVDVAAEQATLLRKGISEIFVNLARRNQVLIDRQIEFLDELEATEDDPDQLSQLYRLDHLATRMRRNAESLLVLAGIEPARTRTRPVPLFDVVRAAIGEVEDFARVDLTSFDEIDVVGNAAVDLGHLLAELMDNAAHFSPPDTRVTIEGRRGRAGYSISIVDRGIGMNDEQLADANELLSSPPPVGLALSRSLGFTVVARLAARYGVSVRLLPGDKAGTSAIVHLSQSLVIARDVDDQWAPDGDYDEIPVAAEPIADEPIAVESMTVESIADEPVAAEPAVAAIVSPMPEPVEPLVAFAVDADTGAGDLDDFESVVRAAWGDDLGDSVDDVSWSLHDASFDDAPLDDAPFDDTPFDQHEFDREFDEATFDEATFDEHDVEPAPEPVHLVTPDAPPATLRDALPMGSQFEKGLADLVEGDAALGPAQLIEPPIEPATTPAPDPAPEVEPAADVAAMQPAAIAGDSAVTSAGLTRRVRRTDRDFEGLDRYRAAATGPSILATKRSPDDVRAMLARYRTGLQRGRTGDDPINPDHESE